jgi:dipeptidyl aminopeptidase/acylaminoacyl peptidase
VTRDFDENPALLAWRPDGLYFSALQKTESRLFRIQPDGARLDTPGQTGWVSSGFSIAKGAQKVAFIGETFGTFAEVYTSPLSKFAPEKRTRFDDQLNGFKLSRREVIRWKSKDGLDLDGILVKPSDFDPAKKYPLLFVIHGGPQGVDAQLKLSRRDVRYYPIERLAARGALVLMVNYRGSAGYGEKFRTLNVRNLGVHDEWDFDSAIDHLVKLGWVDPERIGAMGWSQGGFLSAFLATHSRRFKAVSVGAGISDWATQYGIADMYWYEGQYHGSTTPWDDPEVFKKTAPISYVKGAKTPALIQHGDKDPVAVPANSFELYRALKDNNVPVRFVLYKGFGHSINKPKGNLAVMTHNDEWFVRWIWDGKDPLLSGR